MNPFRHLTPPGRLRILLGAVLVLGVLLVNRGVLQGSFLYLRDDDINIALNPHMGGLSLARLGWMFTDTAYVRRYIPLGWLQFSCIYQGFGLDPVAYHAVGLALHAAVVLLVFRLIERLHERVLGSRPGAWPVACAALGAAWWGVNPMRVETVAWASGNLYGQAVALALASVLCYLRADRGGRRGTWLAASCVLYGASLLTYPLALGLPVALVLLDGLPAGALTAGLRGRRLVEKLPFAAVVGAVAAVTLLARIAQAGVYGQVPGLDVVPLANRAAQAAYVCAYYLAKPWWPTGLSPLYDTLVSFQPLEPRFVASAAVGVALCAITLAWRRTRPWAAAAWFSYLALAVPFFGLTEWPHMTSDRYGCLLAVIEAAVACGLLAGLRSAGARVLAAAAALALLAVLVPINLAQQAIWRDDAAQHAYVAAHLKDPLLADDFRGRQLILQFLRGDEAGASAQIDAGLRRWPGSPGLRKAAAIVAQKERVRAYYGDTPMLAILQEHNALAFAQAGEYREADDHFREALRLDDRFYQAAFDRALVQLHLGRLHEALGSYLISERWRRGDAGDASRRAFLSGLADAARAAGDAPLAEAARAGMRRAGFGI